MLGSPPKGIVNESARRKLKNKDASPTRLVTSQAGGSAGGADDSTDAPWLCVTAFRRFCSEQLV